MFVRAGIVCPALLMGCSSHAPDVKGRWQPVNRFTESTEAIPLTPSHEFYATPVDGTLKNLLERWAKDSGRQLAYRYPNDFTLYAPVARIRTTDLARAAAELSAAYAGRGFEIAIDAKQIVVSANGPQVAPQQQAQPR